MARMIKRDRCSKLTSADSSGGRYASMMYENTAKQTSWYNLCPECEKIFYTDFLGWKWIEDELQYAPREED